MVEKKVLNRDNLPTKFPGVTTLAALLAIDVWSIPGWGQGIIWTLLAILWIGSIVNICREKNINIFENEK